MVVLEGGAEDVSEANGSILVSHEVASPLNRPDPS